jgi:hypothetical protein
VIRPWLRTNVEISDPHIHHPLLLDSDIMLCFMTTFADDIMMAHMDAANTERKTAIAEVAEVGGSCRRNADRDQAKHLPRALLG